MPFIFALFKFDTRVLILNFCLVLVDCQSNCPIMTCNNFFCCFNGDIWSFHLSIFKSHFFWCVNIIDQTMLFKQADDSLLACVKQSSNLRATNLALGSTHFVLVSWSNLMRHSDDLGMELVHIHCFCSSFKEDYLFVWKTLSNDKISLTVCLKHNVGSICIQ